ncbi:exosortase B [Methylobacillus flagellatus]|uniref:exosortase B n=1 Tax=Methylobacillus flagellatus TaxID=405 RepID=UPI002853EFFE|nr:exosortase B [Methylobacillus flagellatus]MDR5172646.1 exosortase B [Methylobacillus flagellatus]
MSLSQSIAVASTQVRKYQHVIPLLIGLLFLFVPTYMNLMDTVWQMQDQAHGPLILMVVLYLIWVDKEVLLDPVNLRQSGRALGILIFVFGLLVYVIGRSQDLLVFDVGSQIPVLAGLLLIFYKVKTLKRFWFPLFFLFFMIPLPGSMLDVVTLPMKVAVSYVAEHVLYWFDYPIARSGVIIQIGQYQLLVADACAGMHTLISLEALGLLYLNIVRHDSLARNLLLALLIIPISFSANVIRVIVLTLITYYFGDEVGQGFVHGFAGILLFVVALTLIISVDSLIQYFVGKRIKRKAGLQS